MHKIIQKAMQQLPETLYRLPGHAEARIPKKQDRSHGHVLILAIERTDPRGASLGLNQS